jgi:hypothetical protein
MKPVARAVQHGLYVTKARTIASQTGTPITNWHTNNTPVATHLPVSYSSPSAQLRLRPPARSNSRRASHPQRRRTCTPPRLTTPPSKGGRERREPSIPHGLELCLLSSPLLSSLSTTLSISSPSSSGSYIPQHPSICPKLRFDAQTVLKATPRVHRHPGLLRE